MAEASDHCAAQQQAQDAYQSAEDASLRLPETTETKNSQDVVVQQPQQEEALQLSHVQHSWQQLSSSLAELDSTSDLLVQLLHNSRQHIQTQHLPPPEDVQQQSSTSSSVAQLQPCNRPDTCSSNTSDSSTAVDDLQQQLSALLAEKHRIEADRQDMALKQGNYKGTIAQLEGALAFSERKVKDQLTTIESLQAQVSSLTGELQEAHGAAAQTPDRCRTAARALQEEADRASMFARNSEAQVKKLKHIVQYEARQLSELLDFAEQERLTLLEKEAALQQELEQVRSRAISAESGASDALAESAALEQQLHATKAELLACQARVEQLEGLLADSEARLQQAQEQASVLAAERDAAARNLLRAEAELNDVSDYSTKMFRQVRFISHVLDKNSAVLGKLPEFSSLTRDLRAFVAANTRTWEPRDGSAAGAPSAGGTAYPTASVSAADTTASGMRDVAGKA